MITPTFLFAGRAVFTITKPDRTHQTYQITHKDAENGFPEAWFLKVVEGGQRTYIGKISRRDGKVKMTKASAERFSTTDSAIVTTAELIVGVIIKNHDLPEGYGLRHEGRCGRCYLPLTTPESIDTGIGPECAKKMGIKHGRDGSKEITSDGFDENQAELEANGIVPTPLKDGLEKAQIFLDAAADSLARLTGGNRSEAEKVVSDIYTAAVATVQAVTDKRSQNESIQALTRKFWEIRDDLRSENDPKKRKRLEQEFMKVKRQIIDMGGETP